MVFKMRFIIFSFLVSSRIFAGGQSCAIRLQPPYCMLKMKPEYVKFDKERRVRYFDQAARERRKVYSHYGRLFYYIDGADSRPTYVNGELLAFVMDNKGALYIQNPYKEDHQKEFHHSSFFAAGEVSFAGKITVNDGYVELVTNSSGHYSPNPEMLDQLISSLSKDYYILYDYWIDQLFTNQKTSQFKAQDIRFTSARSGSNLRPISSYRLQDIGGAPRATWVCCDWGDRDKKFNYNLAPPRPINGNQFNGWDNFR